MMTIKAMLAAGTTVITTAVGATLAVESRYAKGADVDKVEKVLRSEMTKQGNETAVAIKTLRKSNIQDKLYELEVKRELKKITEIELKQYHRYKDELDDVNKEIRTIQRRP